MKEKQIEITNVREFPYNASQVYKMRSNEENIKIWWGPAGFTNTIHKFEFKNSGRWDFIMHGPNGADYKNEIIFLDIVENKYIKFKHISPAFDVEVTFEENGNNTKVTFKMIFENEELATKKQFLFNANEENFDRLENLLNKYFNS